MEYRRIMIFRAVFFCLLFISSLVISGCSRPAATVDGKKISRESVELHVKERLLDQKNSSSDQDRQRLRETVLQELIGEQLVLGEAAVKGITASDEEAKGEVDSVIRRIGEEQYRKALSDRGLTPDAYLGRVKEKLILRRFMDSLVDPASIDEQQMRDHYQGSQTPFLKPARVNMKIIEFRTKDAAAAAVVEMKRSRLDFDAFADKLKADKTAEVTDYGWVSPDYFSPSVSAAIKMLKEGQQGGPYKGQKGYYLVRVRERVGEELAKYEEVKDSIKASILQQRRTEAYLNWIEQKRISAKIVINMK